MQTAKQVWVGGGLLALCNMHPSVRSVQRGHLCPGRAPARARSADEERRLPARGNREPAPLGPAAPAARMAMMWAHGRPPHRRTPGYLVRRADSRKESDTSARAAPRERARDLSRQAVLEAVHKCSVKVSSHVSAIGFSYPTNT